MRIEVEYPRAYPFGLTPGRVNADGSGLGLAIAQWIATAIMARSKH
jgi:hypothetical protein